MTGSRFKDAQLFNDVPLEQLPSSLPKIAHFLFFGSLITAFLVILIAGVTLWTAHQDAKELAQRSSGYLLRGVIGYMDQHLQRYTFALDMTANMLNTPEFATLSDPAKQRMLTIIAESTDYIGSILELDTEGKIVRTSLSPVSHSENFTDRDYFNVHRENPNVGIYVSQPFHSRLRDGDPCIALSRRLANPDGSFAGAIVIVIRMAYIQAFFTDIDMGPNGALLLLSTDGKILARHPAKEGLGAIGTDISQSKVFKQIRAMNASSLIDTAMVDGIKRYYTFAHVPQQPFIVNVALAEEDLFKKWWGRASVIGTTTLITCFIIVALALILRRELYHRALIEASLAHLAITDRLTGLANRGHYDEVIQREWRRASRTGATLALLMIDADHFKTLNDKYGHARGD